MCNKAKTFSYREQTMKVTYTVLAAAFAMLAVAPRSNAQGTKMTVANSAANRVDTASPAGLALPESTTVDTLKKIAAVGTKEAKKPSAFMAMAPITMAKTIVIIQPATPAAIPMRVEMPMSPWMLKNRRIGGRPARAHQPSRKTTSSA